MLWERGTTVVTGGAGLIGSAVIWALNRRGVDDILVMDHLGEDDSSTQLSPLGYNQELNLMYYQYLGLRYRIVREDWNIVNP